MRSIGVAERGSKINGVAQSSDEFRQRLSPDGAKAFDDVKLGIKYPSGAVLFIEGEMPRGVFVLSKGRVKLSLTSPNGKVMILRISKPGEILGLHAVISGLPFQATAETVEPCEMNFVRSDDFLRFLHEQPQAALLAAQQLSASYQETCQQLRAIGLSGSAREKVARFLLEWSERGETRKDGIHARLTLTHEEIGQLVGASRETITRILGDFKEQRWIAVRGSILLLQDKAALEAVVGREETASSPVHAQRVAEETDGRRFPVPPARPYVQAGAFSLA